MTDMNNINALLSKLPQAVTKTAGTDQKQPVLSDFLGLALAPTAPADAAPPLENVPEGLAALTEKIAAALTSDLSATLATDIQTMEFSDEDAVILSAEEMSLLATALNNITPGGTAPTQGLNALPLTTTDNAQPAAPAAAAPVAPPAAEAKPAPMPVLPIAATPLPPQTEALPAEKTDAAARKPQEQYQPQQQSSQAAQNSAPAQTPAPQARSETSPQALLQNTAPQTGGGFGGTLDSGTSGGFGQNSLFKQFSGDGTATASGMSASNEGAPTGFAQYAAAAGRGLPPQTSQMVALQIQRNAAAKIDTFTLQLDPADLGRMDIQLKFKNDGTVKAHLTVDRPETLAMLQKDAQQLERILQQNGLEMDDTSLTFDLRQQSNDDAESMRDRRDALEKSTAPRMGSLQDNTTTTDNVTAYQGYITARGVNITV